MKNALRWFTRGAEFIAAMALALIFITFLIQIFTRYAAKIAWMMPIPAVSDWMGTLEPIGWTVSLISLLWVWIIFFGCSFLVRERDHVTFDIFYLAMPRRGRQVLALATAIIIIATLLYSFGPTWDAIFGSRLMALKKIQTLRMPVTGDKIAIKWLFAPYILLMVAVITRYVWRLYTVIKFDPPGSEPEEPASDEYALAAASYER
jgi:C4-dicarboxylate transporter DctQ subunit